MPDQDLTESTYQGLTKLLDAAGIRKARLLERVQEVISERDSCVGSYKTCRKVLQDSGIPCQFGDGGKPTTDPGMGRDLADCVKSLADELVALRSTDTIPVAKVLAEIDGMREEYDGMRNSPREVLSDLRDRLAPPLRKLHRCKGVRVVVMMHNSRVPYLAEKFPFGFLVHDCHCSIPRKFGLGDCAVVHESAWPALGIEKDAAEWVNSKGETR